MTILGTTKDAWSVATAFYSGLFAYDGWETLNYVTEEIKDLKRTMPRAIVGSTLLVILLYLLVNVSYYLVLTPAEVRTRLLVMTPAHLLVYAYHTIIMRAMKAVHIFSRQRGLDKLAFINLLIRGCLFHQGSLSVIRHKSKSTV